jgi:hypothetical protein
MYATQAIIHHRTFIIVTEKFLDLNTADSQLFGHAPYYGAWTVRNILCPILRAVLLLDRRGLDWSWICPSLLRTGLKPSFLWIWPILHWIKVKSF